MIVIMRLLFALTLLLSAGAPAQLIYECTANGKMTFQDKPCASNAAEKQRMLHTMAPVETATPVPVPSVSKASVVEERIAELERKLAASTRAPATIQQSAPVSFECKDVAGHVWWLHHECPPSAPVYGSIISPYGTQYQTTEQAPVTQRTVSRKSACARIYGAGRDREPASMWDQRYSTYERNAGHDPCR